MLIANQKSLFGTRPREIRQISPLWQEACDKLSSSTHWFHGQSGSLVQ